MPDNANARRLAAVPDLPEQERAEDRDANRARIERHVLGTAMDSPGDIPAMRIHIQPGSFADPVHGHIWEAISTCHDGGEPVHPTAVTEHLIRGGHIRKLPHNAYLFDLYQQALPGQGGHWARLLAERHTWDRVNAGTHKIKRMLDTPGAGLDQVAHLAEHLVTVAAGRGTTGNDGEHIADLAAAYIDGYLDWGKAKGAATPWPDLNQLLTTEGFERGQVVTFGGASGMGKSVAITDIARHTGVELQQPTLIFTMEMTADQVLCRILAGLTGIPEKAIKNRDLTPDQLVRVDEARRRFQDSPLWIVAEPRTVTQIANAVRQHKHRYGSVHTVVVDYVQIVPTEGRKENRQLEVSATMQRLKQLALKEDVLVVTAAQINRAPAQRTDKRPTLADLRESGEIENSSDIVVLIYREDYYDKESPRAGEADFIVAKQRGGVTDTVTVAAQLHLTRFVSMADDWTPSGAAR
ncbi:DnaB-like helicase C-terminal domain-containing protein [Dactylosporangium sp. NPDC000244]|uniref:replicative DNA helicase n=1 Tax=Dactylosporangium sp. NPDC000244 TaxID=3154365 RepID=UPI00331F6BD5